MPPIESTEEHDERRQDRSRMQDPRPVLHQAIRQREGPWMPSVPLRPVQRQLPPQYPKQCEDNTATEIEGLFHRHPSLTPWPARKHDPKNRPQDCQTERAEQPTETQKWIGPE